MPCAIPEGLTVLERGWLSSNNILIHATADEPGAVLVDTGHCNHAAQTVLLVRQALAGAPLARIVNTHLHSDHCGGNAALQGAFGAAVEIPAGQADAVRTWDESRLSYRATGQMCPRFTVQRSFSAGDSWLAGGRRWQTLPAPGHDPHSVMFFEPARGVLISADALWENGFGVVFPELQGEPGFDDVGTVLDAIEALPVRLVIPGHGAPFTDLASALARARARLAGYRADPARHARYAAKVLIKYHLMEVRRMRLDALLRWVDATPQLKHLSARAAPMGARAAAWAESVVQELVSAGALALQDGVVVDL